MDTDNLSGTSFRQIRDLLNLETENKNELLNLVQYSVIAIIPIMIILKIVKTYIPEEDYNKGTLEILVETIGQIAFITSAIWLSDRLVRIIPTYSGSSYPDLFAVNHIIPFFIILATMQTKFGAKLNILFERVIDMWNGTSYAQVEEQNIQETIKPKHQASKADTLDKNPLVPSNRSLTTIPNIETQKNATQSNTEQVHNEKPDFSQMYQNSVHEDMSAMSSEPMAAYDGGGAFSSW